MRVKVSDWGNPRNMEISEDRVSLEISMMPCPKCEQCAARVREVENFIDDYEISGVEWSGHYASVALPAGADPIETIEARLGVSITHCRY